MRYFVQILAVSWFALSPSPVDATQGQNAHSSAEWRIGAIDFGPSAFGYIADVAIHDESLDIYVLDALNYAVQVFSRAGRHIATIGREGSGPGEFRRPSKLGFAGSELWVFDPGRGDVQFFLGDSVVSAVSVPPIDLDGTGIGRVVNVVGVSELPRSFFVIPFVDAFEISKGRIGSAPVLRIEVPYAGVDTLTVLDLQESMAHVPPKGQPGSRAGMFIEQPFGDWDMFRINSSSDVLAVVRRDGESGSATLRFMESDGRLWGEPRNVPWRGRRGDRGAMEGMVAATVEPLVDHLPLLGVDDREELEAMIASAFDRASYLPAVADAVVGYDGSVWLAEPQEVEGVTWRRFWPASDPEKSQLYLPFRSRVLEADRDGVYAVVEGEFGVQYLSRFLLPRR